MNTHPSRRRVVVTGLGWVTPLGHELEAVWRALLAGQSGIGPITRFDATTFPTRFCGHVKDFDWRPLVRDAALHDGILPNTAFALGAAAQAWKHAGLDRDGVAGGHRLGIYLGSGEGILDFESYVAANVGAWDESARRVNSTAWHEVAAARMKAAGEIEQEANMPLTHLALEFGAMGPCSNCLTACAASTQAIGEAAALLREGKVDVMISGGAHTMIHPLGVTGFNRLTALSTRNDEPTTASRPFSADRDGFVLGEGAGILVLETLDHAQARGATILAEITGYGSSADAFRITDMHPEGRGPVAAMRMALDDAGRSVDDIDYISVHGTSTHENDSTETQAIKTVFGTRAGSVPSSSVKSMMGHLIAAAGAVEAIVCILAIRDGIVPPTINLNKPDPECDLDYVPNEARKMKVDMCLSNNYGFGGQNNTLIIERFDHA
ncbi:MAG: beta-ketoacyl-ACP synthase II [Phycisphaeraceae bacterium]|nr:beta-ketoacyl-ACP synthase II [Phycisphaeraceae bacterium]